MTIEATAAVAFEKSGPFRFEQVVLDDLRPEEVLVKLDACGICHTDSKFRERLPLPAVFGHEGTGTVEEVGSSVSAISPGDRAILSYPFCTTCPSCVSGEPYRCELIPKLKFGGSRLDGTQAVSLEGSPITSSFFQQSSFATHAIALQQAIVTVDTDCAPEMLAALPCGVQTGAGAIMNTFQPEKGSSLLVVGVGAVGLSAIMAARLLGLDPIIAIDMHASRLDLARELGASHTIEAADSDIARQISEILPRGVQYALDTSATVPGLKLALNSIGQGGEVGIVSYPNDGKEFPFTTREIFSKVASLRGIVQGFSVPREFLPRLIGLQAEGRFPYEKLISTYAFSDINQAFEDTHSGKAIKPVLLMP